MLSARNVVALKNTVPTSCQVLLHHSVVCGRPTGSHCSVAAEVKSNDPTKKTPASTC